MPAPRARPENERAACAEVEAVYRELAARPVERSCQFSTTCCQFHVTGRVPHLTAGEALVAARGLRASGRKALPERKDGACPMLGQNGRCMIYAARPFGCRTHYCRAAGGPLERRELIDLIRRLEKVDADLAGDGPRPIQGAMDSALERFF